MINPAQIPDEVVEEAATLAMRYDDASFAAAAIRALKGDT